MLLEFDARVGDVLDRHLDAQLAAGVAHLLGQLADGERLGELVEHPELTRLGRVLGRQLDAAQGVDDVQEAARLPAPAVHRQRMADHGLHAEAVERGAERLVVVEARDQPLVQLCLVGLDAVHDALVEVGGAKTPHAAGEVQVGRVVHLRAVIQRAGQLGERQPVAATLVLDIHETLLDIDVGRAVLAHRAELDQMRVGDMLADSPQQLERADHIRLLGQHGVVDALHRKRGARLLAVVDDRVRLHVAHDVGDEGALRDVADLGVDRLSRHLPPGRDALVKRCDRCQRVGAGVQMPAAAGEVVHHRHGVPLAGET